MLLNRVELARCDCILFVFVSLREVDAHVLDEGAGDGGREAERFSAGHFGRVLQNHLNSGSASCQM